jgi:hypothetical protein
MRKDGDSRCGGMLKSNEKETNSNTIADVKKT